MKLKIKEYFGKKYPAEKKLSDEAGLEWGRVVWRVINFSFVASGILSILTIIFLGNPIYNAFKGTYIVDFFFKTSYFFPLIFMFFIIYFASPLFIRLVIKEQRLIIWMSQKIIDKYIKSYYKNNKSDPPFLTKYFEAHKKINNWMMSKPKWMRKLIIVGVVSSVYIINIIGNLPSMISMVQGMLITNSTQVTGIIRSPFG